MSHPDPRPPAADGEREDPRVWLIETLQSHIYADATGLAPAVIGHHLFGFEQAADAILSRLTAAEAGREEAEKALTALRRVHRWNVEHSDGEVLVCRNNHDKGDDCDWERFVPEERLTDAEAERDEALRISAEALALVPKHAVEAAKAEIHRDVAVAERDAALARVERLENALAGAVNRLNSGKSAASDWLYVVSEAGDLEVEMPSGFVAEPHAALTEAQPKGDQ